MARLIDADALMEKQYYVEYWNGSGESEDTVVSIVEIEDAPTVDAVFVCRCKDCKYKCWIQEPCHGKSIDYCRRLKCPVDDNFFCGFGERKGGAE